MIGPEERSAGEEDEELFAQWVEMWQAEFSRQGIEILRNRYDENIDPPGWVALTS